MVPDVAGGVWGVEEEDNDEGEAPEWEKVERQER